ncbi:phosphoribosylanthranilate isomerase [Melioribacteraceae bacterium 4301-Me]|uniref:phosphoribosylanthranilate isomerase n=1 Tax=Pyranulibacter aquaticus TaxID=3163344 RepID=UPI00359A8B69
MKVKICGITNLEDALVCIENGADMLGFIFYEKSKRYISFDYAKEILQQLPPTVNKVGVFVNDKYQTINDAAKKIGLDVIQLHGDESPEFTEKITLPVFKSFRISESFDWSGIKQYKKIIPLLDTYSKNQFGGTGKHFNWNLIPDEYKHSIILSGGITIDKLERIFNEIKPLAIDISSSLEITPGKKDHKKVKEFLAKFNQLRRQTC